MFNVHLEIRRDLIEDTLVPLSEILRGRRKERKKKRV
jgi:hypothetical protein